MTRCKVRSDRFFFVYPNRINLCDYCYFMDKNVQSLAHFHWSEDRRRNALKNFIFLHIFRSIFILNTANKFTTVSGEKLSVDEANSRRREKITSVKKRFVPRQVHFYNYIIKSAMIDRNLQRCQLKGDDVWILYLLVNVSLALSAPPPLCHLVVTHRKIGWWLIVGWGRFFLGTWLSSCRRKSLNVRCPLFGGRNRFSISVSTTTFGSLLTIGIQQFYRYLTILLILKQKETNIIELFYFQFNSGFNYFFTYYYYYYIFFQLK